MELRKYKETGQKYTEKASDIARNLMLAGVGIIWIIRSDESGLSLDNPILLAPLIFLAITLSIDFLQYVIGGFIWMKFYRNKEKSGVKADEDVKSAIWRSELLYIIYYIKFLFMIISYALLIRALFSIV